MELYSVGSQGRTLMELMTNAEVREALHVSKQLLYYYVKCGYIRRVSYRRQHLYLKEDVLKLLK